MQEVELKTRESINVFPQTINNESIKGSNYQPREAERQQKKIVKSTSTLTICKILKVAIGTGVLAMPQGFRDVHISGGIIVLIIGMILQYYSWYVLVRAMEEKTKLENQKQLEKMISFKKSVSLMESNDSINTTRTAGPTTRLITMHIIQKEIEEAERKEKELQETIKQEKKRIKEEQRKQKISEDRKDYKDFSIYDLFRQEFKDSKRSILALQATTLFQIFGCDVSYIIYFRQSLENISPIFQIFWVRMVEGIILVILIMVFSFYKRLESLRGYVMFGSYVSLIILYFVVSLCLFQVKLNGQIPPNVGTPFARHYPEPIQYNTGVHLHSIPQFFGVALFAYDINALITEIRQEMKFPYKFPRTLFASMIFEFMVYAFIGTVGYMAYGQYTYDIITTNVTITLEGIGKGISIFFLGLQVLYSISLMITVTLFNVVAFRIITEIIYGSNALETKVPFKIKFIMRTMFISIIVFTAMFFQQFTIVISLMGSVSTVNLGFVLPYILYLKFKGDDASKIRFTINTIVLLFGLMGGILGVVFTFV